MLGTRKHSFLTKCKYCVVSSGVARLIWHPGRVITVFPLKNIMNFNKSKLLIEFPYTGFFARQFKTC